MDRSHYVGDNELASSATAWLVLVALLTSLVVAASFSAGEGDAGAGSGTGASDVVSALVPTVTTTTIHAPGTCRVSIAGGKPALRTEPSGLGRRILTVPSGDYVVAAAKTLTHGSQQRWLQIDVDGISGWVADRAFTIDARTAECA